jgi:hypothetical protein
LSLELPFLGLLVERLLEDRGWYVRIP